jgi:ABC-type nitrate/sulfonate/bicarbonate transport system permease component
VTRRVPSYAAPARSDSQRWSQRSRWSSSRFAPGVINRSSSRFRLPRSACETWVAALASAPVVPMYLLFLVIFGRSATTIVMIGFAGLPPVVLKTVEGLANRGLGYLIIQSYTTFDMPRMYALLIVLFVIAIRLNALIGRYAVGARAS